MSDAQAMTMTGRAPSSVLGSAKLALARPTTDGWLVGLVVVMSTVGVVMVGSASSVISMSLYGSPWSILSKELMWVGMGLLVFWFFSRTDHHRWRTLAPLLMAVTVGLLVVVLAPGLGVTSGGSSRWIGFGQFRVQPSELMKLALALFGADLIVRRQERGATSRQLIGPMAIVTGLGAFLVVLQPDMGTAMVLVVIAVALLFSAGVPLGPVMKGLAILAVLVAFAAVAMPYRRERLLSFINPGAKASGSGYQVVQSLIGLGSGHLTGLGLGGSHEKWGLLPNAHTDFIFSIIGEELGLLGAMAVLTLVCLFAFKGLKAAEQANDRFGSLLGVALVAWIASEAIINVGAVIGVLPVTGIPLPFISFGGSSLLITMAAAGLLVNIARQSRGLTPQSRSRRLGSTSSKKRAASRPRSQAGSASRTTRAASSTRKASPPRRPARATSTSRSRPSRPARAR